MALEVRVVTGTLTDVLNDYTDFEFAGFGTPQACIVYMSDASTSSNPTASVNQSVGVFDGTNQYAMCWSQRISVSASGGAGRFANSGRIALSKLKTSSAPTYNTVAEYTASWVPSGNGVRLTLSEDSTGIERYCTVVLIKGAASVKANTVAMNGTTTVNHEGVGFEADLLFWLSVGLSTGFDGQVENNITSCSVGIAKNNRAGTVVQHCVSINSAAGSTSVVNVSVNDAVISRQYFEDGATIDRTGTVSDFDSLGFSTVLSSTTFNPLCAYLAIRLDNTDDAWLGIIDTKTTTGTQAYTGPGWEPQALLVMGMPETAVNSNSTSPSSGVTFGAAANAASGFTQECYATAIVDADATPAEMSRRTASLLDLRNTSDTAIAVGNLDSFDSNGFTIDYTTANASARKVIALAFKAAAGGGAPTISDLKAVSITATTVQATYDYAF